MRGVHDDNLSFGTVQHTDSSHHTYCDTSLAGILARLLIEQQQKGNRSWGRQQEH